MAGNFDNLTTKRYKTCGHSHPILDESGHYDDVQCIFNKEVRWCGTDPCPLDQFDKEEDR